MNVDSFETLREIMNVTARGTGDGQTRQRRLDIYLNDYLAGATAGVELARSMAQEHGDSPYGDDLKNLRRRSRRTGRPCCDSWQTSTFP
ncbi:hypothetical protein [Streptomyces vastus]|uniref:Uncharacterized protein n=1 Tax=Streptomyces vastus TaxID=285451 RepID=A0ABN3RPY4_9ACTN